MAMTTSGRRRLPEGEYLAKIGTITSEAVEGNRWNWTRLKIPFLIEDPETGETVTITFISSNTVAPGSRLYPILKGILGSEPTPGLNLQDLTNRKVFVTVQHSVDNRGLRWDIVVSVRRATKQE